MEEENSENKKPTIDHLINNLSPNFQNNETQFQNYGYSLPTSPTNAHIWPDYNHAESPNLSTTFLQDNFHCHNRNSLPFIFNTDENVLPTMIDVGGGNFVVYGTNTHRNAAPYNMNKNRSFNNNYNMDSSLSDYNLFRGNLQASQCSNQTQSMNGHTEGNSGTQTQLLDNLLGNWSCNQSGTYSPFGNTVQQTGRSSSESDCMFDSKTTKKTRMVAQVRPMRMSYSDVLTKSIQPTITKPSKQKQDTGNKTAKVEEKTKNVKPIVNNITAKSNTLSRQQSGVFSDGVGSDDQTTPTANVNKKSGQKKMTGQLISDEKKDTNLLNEELKEKKLNGGNNNKKKKDKWETVALNNCKNNSNRSTSNKPLQINNNLHGDKNMYNNKFGSSNDIRGQQALSNNNKNDPSQKSNTNNSNNNGGGSGGGSGSGNNSTTTTTSSNSSRRGNSATADKNNKKNKSRKKEQQSVLAQAIKKTIDQYTNLLIKIICWFINLIYDVCLLSANLCLHMFTVCCEVCVDRFNNMYTSISSRSWLDYKFWRFRKKEESKTGDEDEQGGKTKNKLPKGLDKNIPLPSTGEEAMKRLLACKGKDPYSILGVTQTCTDDDIKKYYKRQAFLVHPDKNNQPGAEEAFKILVHAFDIIGEPEHRKSYDRRVAETQQVEQAWSELSDLLQQLHKKMEYAANTIRCTNCNKRHKRTLLDRPLYAARMCSQCKIHHAVREGDIWAEKTMFGLIWRYYACMDGGVYDISEWAACQGGAIKNLKPNTHNVQYRIVLGGKQQQPQPGTSSKHSQNEPDLEEFLSNLYSKQGNGNNESSNTDPSSAFGLNRNRRKAKKKK